MARPLQRVAPKLPRGFTLVELLVVISIIMLITTVALATLNTDRYSRESREAARELTVMIQSARDTAVQQGRPVGIQIDRLVNPDNSIRAGVGIRISLVEQPPPYSGDSIDSRAQIQAQGNSIRVQSLGPRDMRTGTSLGTDMGYMNSVRPGDRMRLGDLSHEFIIQATPNNRGFLDQNSFPWTLVPANGSLNLATYGTLIGVPPGGLRYEIHRTPVKVPGRSVELPATVCVDMNLSGSGNGGAQFGNSNGPLIILFGPTGSVHSVLGYQRANATQLTPDRTINPSLPVHLMLGRLANVGIAPPGSLPNPLPQSGDPVSNLLDPDSRWVSIFPLTGRVKVSPNQQGVNVFAARANTFDQITRGAN